MLHELLVADEDAGMRLDVWLESRLAGLSRSLVARCIKDGCCRVEPGKAKPGYRLRGGERVSIVVPELEPLTVEPEEIPLTVLYEDEGLVIVDKAPGMVVHPAIGHPRGTLVNALLGRYGDHLDGEVWRPGLIHRLDADTSGVIAVAKNARSLAHYQAAFKQRRVDKRYLALLHGAPAADLLRCEAALGRHPKDFRKRAVLASEANGAKAALTTFVVRQRHADHCVVEARPRTGRTHQIRVHAAHLRHPILADRVYGRSDRWPLTSSGEAPVLRRQALHAWRLRLPRPDGGTVLVEAPVPADLAPWIEAAGDLRPLSEPGREA